MRSVHARAGNDAGAGTLRAVHSGRAAAQPLNHHLIASAKQLGHFARPGRMQRQTAYCPLGILNIAKRVGVAEYQNAFCAFGGPGKGGDPRNKEAARHGGHAYPSHVSSLFMAAA